MALLIAATVLLGAPIRSLVSILVFSVRLRTPLTHCRKMAEGLSNVLQVTYTDGLVRGVANLCE